MSRVSLLNRDPSFKSDVCQRVSDKGVVCEGISKDNIVMISAPFDEVRRTDKSISSSEDLQLAGQRIKEREMVKKRMLEKKENEGYILIGSLTFTGILALGSLIFMAIKSIIVR